MVARNANEAIVALPMVPGGVCVWNLESGGRFSVDAVGRLQSP